MASTKRYGGLTGGILPEQRLASGADHPARAVRLFHDAASQGDGRGRARSLSVVEVATQLSFPAASAARGRQVPAQVLTTAPSRLLVGLLQRVSLHQTP